MIQELNDWSKDRIMFEYYLKEFQKELEVVTNRLGQNKSTDQISRIANLAIFWLPLGIKDLIVEASNFLPAEWKGKINRFFSKIPNMEGQDYSTIP